MPAVEMKSDIYWIGVNDRTTDLFEGLWPITQEGVSYNAYCIHDEKKVIIDLAKGFKSDEFFERVDEIFPVSDVDYIVMNHIEPDHSGILKTLLRIADHVTILCSQKCKKMLEDFYGVTDNVKVVEDGEILKLGKRSLQFFHTPFVHWPETMMTYETADKILFSCDGFGSYGALRGAIFDDECTNPKFYEKEALRYYVNIVAKFSNSVLKAIEKLNDIEIGIIAPSHGLIWRDNPGRIVQLYKQWAEYAKGETNLGVTLIYGSMYGNTEKMMNAVAQGISNRGVEVEIFDVARTHVSYILPSLWIKSGVMIGAPTYEGMLFPYMAQVVQMAVLKRIINKQYGLFGSFGWSGGALKDLQRIVDPVKWDLIESFEFYGAPTKEELQKGEEFGERFIKRIQG